MYGPRRTLAKVRAQYHMARRYEVLPEPSMKFKDDQVFGIIGCGNYAYSTIAYYLQREFGGRIRACMDIDAHRAASLAQAYNVPFHTTDAARIVEDPKIKQVFIASNHASHAEYAIQCLNAGKSVYIEKPPVVNEAQLSRLLVAVRESPGKIFLGYNRPGSRFGRIILRQLSLEPGSAVINWFVAGHKIDPDHWYYKPEEGGRVLGNLCHWIDFTLAMAGVDAFPVTIVPARHSQSDSNIAVSYVFANGTVAAITFSAKGHTFEGVMERLSIHKGDILITMDDYRVMTVRRGASKKRYVNYLRDHGHKRNIVGAARSVLMDEPQDKSRVIARLEKSSTLMLATRRALEECAPVTVQ